MRVLVVIPEGCSNGGTGRFLARLLALHEARGYVTALLAPAHLINDQLTELAARHGVAVIAAESRTVAETPPLLTPWFDLLFSWRSVRSWRPDLLVVSTADPGRMSVALYFPLPVLYILHSTPEHVFRPLPRLYLRTGARLNNRVATVSEAAARSIESTMGFPAGAVAVLYNSTPAVKTGARAGAPVVVTAGHLVRYKDPFGWLAAAQGVLRQKPETTFVWLGDGELLAALRERVASLGLEERILLPGFVPDPSFWLDEAQVYFQPSLRESHGIAVLEAMARRLPCVVADTGGLPESVLDGETGFVSPPGDTGAFAARILDLLQDPVLRERMGHAGALRVERHFSETEQEQRLMTLYRQLVKEGKHL